MQTKVFFVQISSAESEDKANKKMLLFEEAINKFLEENKDFRRMQPMQSSGGTRYDVHTTITVILQSS